MSGDPDEEGRRRAARALADELRSAIGALTDQDVPAAGLARATELARDLNRELSGAKRLRWYEGGPFSAFPTPEAGRAYVDQSPIRGQLNPIAPPMVSGQPVEREDGSPAVVATATLGVAYEGPPHGVHGGWVAALFDDLLGQAQQLVQKAGVTATLKVRYRDITPLDQELQLRAWIHEDRGRRVVARATCHAGDTLTADAEAVFLGVDFEEIRGRMQERREPA